MMKADDYGENPIIRCYLYEGNKDLQPYRYAKNNIFLAPLAGITDRAFRELAAEQGAGLTFTEMVSAKGIKYNNKKTFELLQVGEGERVGVQLFGREPETVARTAAALAESSAGQIALIDLNMGCPAPKIVNNGEGAALMKEPRLAAAVIKAVKQAVQLPVTVKFRKGFAKDENTCVSFAQMAEQAGADALTVHGRTREQYYEGRADWDAIAAVKQNVGIHVNANGDIASPEDAKRIFEHTHADGIMVARGALGNPFIFREILDYLENGSYSLPTWRDKAMMAVRQAELACAYKGEAVAMREMRKHGAWYVKGRKNAARLRERLVRISSLEEFRNIMLEIACMEQE